MLHSPKALQYLFPLFQVFQFATLDPPMARLPILKFHLAYWADRAAAFVRLL